MSVKIASENAVRAVEIVLALLFVFLVVKLISALMLTGATGLPPKMNTTTSDVNSAAQTRFDSKVLGEFDVFNRARGAQGTVDVQENAPETNLNLKVFGMRADLRGSSSSAIIQTPDMKQATYYLGDEIIPGVSLKRVDIDYVILDRNGTPERLSRQGRTEDELATSTVEISGLSFKANAMINNLRFYPKVEGRKIVGYRILARRGNTLETYGFKQNDVITAINGHDMTQARVNLSGLWKDFRIARYASIQLIRDGNPMTLEVNLQ
ncbi:MAG: hypothetical protein COA69_04205 [Robiginitomaculum sp.]|nr:MAG: hypothetical protein COA69_04205 [Robiginitomaculum sp.]